MPRKVELLNGGVVTDRDPMLLKPGQLASVRNMVYRNGAAGLERATGRQVFGVVSATATAVNGLRDLYFDSGDHFLVAMAGAEYRTSPVADTGTFSALASITAGTSLEVVQYRNRFFLMNGASSVASAIGSNLVVYQSATSAGTPLSTRTHGLLPVQAAPNVTTASGAFSQSVTGYYEYWTTEVSRITQDGAILVLEGAFDSENGVTTVYVSSTAVQPTIQLPTVRNSSATHWRIYRSPKKELASDKKFPTGYMIAELAISGTSGVTSHTDTVTNASASSFFASAVGSGPYTGEWASASSMIADDGVYASATHTGGQFSKKSQGLYAYSLSGVKGSIRGIAVEVQGYVSTGTTPMPITVRIGTRDASFKFNGKVASKSGILTSTNSASPTTITLGGTTDRWVTTDGSVLVDSDFTSGLVMLVIESAQGNPDNRAVGIDYVKMYVYYGASVDSTVVYPTVVYTFGDITAQVSKNFPAPSAFTGDLFQDSLVLNDVSNPSVIRYSFPGDSEAFPPTYFLDFETRDNDRVQCIRVVNGRLMVGLENSLHRVNYLPSERDASFDRGKASDVVSGMCGIVGPMLACTFTIDGQSEQMAFVSHKGIHSTDGFNFITRTKNQNWRNYISLTSTSTPIALLNDPENRMLRFFYRNDSLGNETYMCLHLSYDPADIDAEGSFKVSGPVHCRNYSGGQYASVESAWAVPRSDGNTGIYIGYGGTATAAGAGKVYFETGTAIPSQDDTCQWTSRRIYGGGLTGEWMLDDLYGYCGSYSGAPLLTYTFSGTKTNDSGATSRGSKSITLRGQVLHKVTPKVQCEGLQITMQASGAGTFSQELIVFGSTDYGREDAGT